MAKCKVFGIGFHKTGTTTLDIALKELGYNVLGSRTDLANTLSKGKLEEIFQVTDQYDALQDNPWPLLYKQLDLRYPDSKFILTYRDEQSWINSIVNHFGTDNTMMRKLIYGIGHPKGNESTYLEKYQRHNREVQEYFKNRPNDLLILNWKEDSNWEKICKFLNLPIPTKNFPHANKGNYLIPFKYHQKIVKTKIKVLKMIKGQNEKKKLS